MLTTCQNIDGDSNLRSRRIRHCRGGSDTRQPRLSSGSPQNGPISAGSARSPARAPQPFKPRRSECWRYIRVPIRHGRCMGDSRERTLTLRVKNTTTRCHIPTGPTRRRRSRLHRRSEKRKQQHQKRQDHPRHQAQTPHGNRHRTLLHAHRFREFSNPQSKPRHGPHKNSLLLRPRPLHKTSRPRNPPPQLPRNDANHPLPALTRRPPPLHPTFHIAKNRAVAQHTRATEPLLRAHRLPARPLLGQPVRTGAGRLLRPGGTSAGHEYPDQDAEREDGLRAGDRERAAAAFERGAWGEVGVDYYFADCGGGVLCVSAGV